MNKSSSFNNTYYFDARGITHHPLINGKPILIPTFPPPQEIGPHVQNSLKSLSENFICQDGSLPKIEPDYLKTRASDLISFFSKTYMCVSTICGLLRENKNKKYIYLW